MIGRPPSAAEELRPPAPPRARQEAAPAERPLLAGAKQPPQSSTAPAAPRPSPGGVDLPAGHGPPGGASSSLPAQARERPANVLPRSGTRPQAYTWVDRRRRRRRRMRLRPADPWRRAKASLAVFTRNPLAMAGVMLLLIFLGMAAAHPILMRAVWDRNTYDPVVGYDVEIFPHPSLPSARHLLGTDTLGRDVLSILLACTPQTLQMAIMAAITSAVIGTVAGMASGYFRGWIDSFFSHIADVCLLAPAPLVMIIIGFTFDIQPLQFGLVYGILSGLGAVGIVMRSHALLLMTKPFIDASRVAGGGAGHILFRHLLPHMLPLAAVNMLLTVTGAIFANGFIAFMGLSRAQLNWGSMIYDSFTYQAVNTTITWNVLVPAALAISLFAASFYMIGRGLQEVVEPRLRSQRT